MKPILNFFILLLFFATSTKAQNPFNQLKDNEMVLSFKILANLNPEQFAIKFTISQIGETAKDCEILMGKRLKQMADSLNAKSGIKTSEISTQFLSLNPIFEGELRNFSNNYIEKPKAFRLQKSLMVKTKKEQQIDEVVSIAAAFEIYDLSSIECIHTNHNHIIDSLRTLAIEGLDKKARKVEGLSLDLEDPMITVAERFNTFCVYEKSNIETIEGKGQQSADALKNKMNPVGKSHQISYLSTHKKGDFDLIINAEHPNAGLSFHFELFAKYAMEPSSEIVNKTKFYIIDSNGSVKEVAMPKR